MSLKSALKKICPKWISFFWRNLHHNIQVLPYYFESIILHSKLNQYCPCCKLKFRRFTDGRFICSPKRFNPHRYELIPQKVICPVCHSLPRHRILADWAEKHIDIFKHASVLYFAPENGMRLWMKRNSIPYTSADLFAEADLMIDIQSTGLPDESYDVIICNHVLEHVDDFRMALKEMYRILRRGGSFICSFPMDPKIELLDEDPSVDTEEERVQRFGQNDHKRVFGMNADKFLIEAGFEVEIISGADCPDEIMPVVGPADYDINRLFRCVKA